MTVTKRHIHLICNAHLDPVWLWEWQEGAAETISTFRVAAELCEKNNTFIFNHNEAILYKWVQEYEPQLFKRIQKLVKAGKWNIMGGWYLQPDCNMPSGESFVRQMMLGKSYFKKYFGVDVTTAINFDPFGHTRGLVQIMAKAGFDSYLFGRPMPDFLKLPADDFVWVGYDGSRVLATRFGGWYNSPLGKAAETIEQRIKDNPDRHVFALLWGVGNHGGGPSKKDVADINKLIRQRKDVEISHSTPQAHFADLQQHAASLPAYDKDLNPWAVGCYSSMIRIKQKHRLLENELYGLEKMATTAAVQGLMKYPYDQIHEALCDLMTGEFHDVLPGSSIQPVEDAALRMYDHALEIVGKLKAHAFFALASGQKKAKQDQIPIIIYNPHPFASRQIVECEFQLADFSDTRIFTQVYVYHNGKLIASQLEQELSNLPVDWRKRIIFEADLEPGQMNRFDCKLQEMDKKPTLDAKPQNGKIAFTTKDIDVAINTQTGFIDAYRVGGVDFVGKGAFEPIVITDDEDSWGMRGISFPNVAGAFKLSSKSEAAQFAGVKSAELEPVRIIEDGPVRTVVEALFSYNKSSICQRYKLPKNGVEIEVETRVQWNEKDKMLKLSIPTLGRDCRYLGQVAYGVGELPANGNEAVAQKWVAAISDRDDMALTCINDGTYSSDFCDNRLRLTLLRSPGYSAHPVKNFTILKQDRFAPRIDQGERLFRFWLNAGKVNERLERIDREALIKNEKPFALSFFPCGMGKKPKPLAVLSDGVVQIAAIKRAENNNNIIIRLFEPTGKKRTTTLSLPFIGKKIRVALSGFEIKTLSINPKTGKYTQTDLLENVIRGS
jgi:alpha-mannosidase